MRILHVARYGSVKGGAETYIEALCEGQRAAGHGVALAFGLEPDHGRPEVAGGVQVRGLDDPAAGDEVREAFRDVLTRAHPDVVHVHLPDVPWIARVCSEIAPTLLAVHDHRLDCPVGTKYWAAWSRRCTVRPGVWCLGYNVAAHCGSLRANATLVPYRAWREARRAAGPLRIQVFSEFMRGEIARSGYDVARVGVTPYPVPRAPEAATPDDLDARPVVYASGRLNKEKGFHQLIAALDRVRPPVHLVIAGDGHERAALERRARSAGGGHRVTFPGWLPPDRVAGYRARAAVVVVPSMWPEPFGIVGLEAMAAGKPVVAFDSGGIREWLTDGDNGVLVRAGDVLALARALSDMLADPAARERMGDAGRARAEREFSLAAHVERVLSLYREVP